VSIGTDYAGSSTEGVLGADRPHPRAYGTFPRILRKYVREEHLLTLPEAIHKFTALAAQRERLRDRGVIQRGMWADLVVFDPDSIADRATYDDPNQFSVGMWYVLVNGVPVIADKKLTGALPGRVLYGPGYNSGAAVPASLGTQATPDSIAQHLIALEQQWNDAILANDSSAAAAFMANEWTEITSDGSVLTRAEDLDELVGGYHATALRLSGIAVQVYGDAAVVSGISEERSSYRGKDTSGRFRWMDVWVRRAGRWQCVVSTVWALGALAQDRQVAVTVDDLPYVTGDSGALSPADVTTAAEVNQQLIAALRQHHVPVTGFVIQQSVEELGGAAATRILADWTSGAFDLGNHTYSHPDINGLSLAQIEGEISRGEASIVPLMREAGKRPGFFRFPMNHTGDTRERHDQVASFLSQRGYRVAPCTIDNSDYLFNQAYVRMLAAHDSAAVRLRAEYLAYTSAEIDYYAALGRQVFGYEPPEVMLLHDNRLNADMINELLALFEQKHYRFVSLDSALSDSAYRTPDTYVTSYGPMWGYRWALERGVKVDGRLEPDPPDWILRYRRK
jgi:peptidoglycan/xylan/chitin deacetylase (PgdA/CDA1 family)